MLNGLENSVVEVNCEPLPWGPENPRGNAWVARETLLGTESEAQRSIEPRSARYWKILNPNVRNGVGAPVAYKLVPGSTPTLLADPDSSVAKRAGFATRACPWPRCRY